MTRISRKELLSVFDAQTLGFVSVTLLISLEGGQVMGKMSWRMPDLTWGYSTPLRVSRAAATPMMNTGSLNRGCEVTNISSLPSPIWTSNIRGSACTWGTILYGQKILRGFALPGTGR